MMHALNFSLLPTILRHPLFRGLPAYIADPLSELRLPETYDRLRTASMLFSDVSERNESWLNQGYLRAALSEFRSVHQALRWDVGGKRFYAPVNSQNPLIHLVLRLRRLTVYVASAKTSQESVTGRFAFGEKASTSEITIVAIDNIHEYIALESFSDYDPAHVKEICDWFDKAQREFGADHVLNIGVMQYCLELVDHYKDRRPGTQTTPPEDENWIA